VASHQGSAFAFTPRAWYTARHIHNPMVANVVPGDGGCIKAYEFFNNAGARFELELGHDAGPNVCFFGSRVHHAMRTLRGPFFGIQTYCVVLPRGGPAPTLHVDRMLEDMRIFDTQWRAMLGLKGIPPDALVAQVSAAARAFERRVRDRMAALTPLAANAANAANAPTGPWRRKNRAYVKKHQEAFNRAHRESLNARRSARYFDKRARKFEAEGKAEEADQARWEASIRWARVRRLSGRGA